LINNALTLFVKPLDLLPLAETINLAPPVPDLVKGAKPFNGTLCLMISVTGDTVLESVKKLLLLKLTAKRC
jgi:hypothetical protein